jgi:hypothetical protein
MHAREHCPSRSLESDYGTLINNRPVDRALFWNDPRLGKLLLGLGATVAELVRAIAGRGRATTRLCQPPDHLGLILRPEPTVRP